MTEYLLTGVTGGLGSVVLSTLLSSGVPASSITCTSTNASNSTRFTSQNLKFVQLDFNDATKLAAAFQGVRNLFFVSTNTFNAEERVRQHTNVILAAKQAGVGHVWYTSLAFGGRTGQSKVDVQQAHLVTERLMREHLGGEEGTKWTSVREGLYIDAFPLWLNWYPTDRKQVLYLPDDGGRGVAWATREELGEATAKLMLKGGEENRIVLLSGPEAQTYQQIVDVINSTTNRQVTIQTVSPEEYARLSAQNDEGNKPEAFFLAWASASEAIANGDAEELSPLLEELLGRKPTDGKTWVKKALEANPNYTWHQNYFK